MAKSKSIKNSQALKLIAEAKRIGSESLSDAAKNDDVHLFPEKTLAEIKKSKLLTMCTKKKHGGLAVGISPGTNLALLKILKYIGGGNLVMGRVLEGHINAQFLINEFGTKKQKKYFARQAFAGKLFGVWNTQAANGTVLSRRKKENYLLNGSKTFATGVDFVTNPIVTAALPSGSWQMCIVPLKDAKLVTEVLWWQPMGMKSSRSYKVTFENMPISNFNLLGKSGSYYQQPSFSGGAVRFAAVQLGAAEMLLTETIKYLRSLKRTDDPYQKIRIGEMTIAVSSGNQWLEGAAKHMDQLMKNNTSKNAELFLTYTNMMRTAIEQICTEVMALCQKCIGARGLNKPHHFERIIRDLNTYLRQPAPDASLADIGRFGLQSQTEIEKLWNLKTKNQ